MLGFSPIAAMPIADDAPAVIQASATSAQMSVKITGSTPISSTSSGTQRIGATMTATVRIRAL